MCTVGIYDSDFMDYGRVIPNLECAKLCAYYKKKKDIAVLAPYLEPSLYTEFYIRKEYDDGIYPQEYFKENVHYGGRAFSPKEYIPLPPEIEYMQPDFSIYKKHIAKYGETRALEMEFRRFLRSFNLRLSVDGAKADSKSLDSCYRDIPQNCGGILIHDYFPGKIENLREILTDVSNSMTTLSNKPKKLPIGNKYPIDVYDSEELRKWGDIRPMRGAFFLRYHGLINNDVLKELIEKNPNFCRQIYYVVDGGCSSEKEFLETRALEIFKQVLYCRLTNTRILLKYEEGFFKTKELKDYIAILNCFALQKWQENFLSTTQSFFKYCSCKPQRDYRDILARMNRVNQYQMREVFMYMRIHNYQLFEMFYNWDKVYIEGGEIKNEWSKY